MSQCPNNEVMRDSSAPGGNDGHCENTGNGAVESSHAPRCSADDVMYVTGMAPRVDKLEAFLANKSTQYKFIIMLAYARGLEIELRQLRQNDQGEAQPPAKKL